MSGHRVVRDPVTLARTSAAHPPEGWHQRWLYVGEEAARRWLRFGSKQDFRRPMGMMERLFFGQARERARSLAEAVLRTARAAQDAHVFCSLGPGDAQLDRDVIAALSEAGLAPAYVPVDISETLLRHAMARLADITAVPVGILCDFEERFPFIEECVREHEPGPGIFSLLGNTLGNLDRGEYAVLAGVSAALRSGDRLLLSVSTKGPGWESEPDPYAGAEGYPTLVRRFIAGGLDDSLEQARGGPSPEERFLTEVAFETGTSDVPGAACVDLLAKTSGRRLISVRRYQWTSLLSWLRTEVGLDPVASEEVVYGGIEGAGCSLLRRL